MIMLPSKNKYMSYISIYAILFLITGILKLFLLIESIRQIKLSNQK